MACRLFACRRDSLGKTKRVVPIGRMAAGLLQQDDSMIPNNFLPLRVHWMFMPLE